MTMLRSGARDQDRFAPIKVEKSFTDLFIRIHTTPRTNLKPIPFAKMAPTKDDKRFFDLLVEFTSLCHRIPFHAQSIDQEAVLAHINRLSPSNTQREFLLSLLNAPPTLVDADPLLTAELNKDIASQVVQDVLRDSQASDEQAAQATAPLARTPYLRLSELDDIIAEQAGKLDVVDLLWRSKVSKLCKLGIIIAPILANTEGTSQLLFSHLACRYRIDAPGGELRTVSFDDCGWGFLRKVTDKEIVVDHSRNVIHVANCESIVALATRLSLLSINGHIASRYDTIRDPIQEIAPFKTGHPYLDVVVLSNGGIIISAKPGLHLLVSVAARREGVEIYALLKSS